MEHSEEEVVASANELIAELNAMGHPAIFFITGNFASGKTTLAKELFSRLSFVHIIHIGIITKTIRLLCPDLLVSKFPGDGGMILNEAFRSIISSYTNSGVNAIFEGVQIDIPVVSTMPEVLGGVVLQTSEDTSSVFANRPHSHFKRHADGIRPISYPDSPIFKTIQNSINGQNQTRLETLFFLEKLLRKKISNVKE